MQQKAAAKPIEPMLRIGTSIGIPAALCSLGLDPEKVLSEAGADVGIFNDPDNLISFYARSRLLAHCAAAADCAHFGLLAAQQAGLHSLGLVDQREFEPSRYLDCWLDMTLRGLRAPGAIA